MKANWKTLLFLITGVVLVALLITFFIGKKQDREEDNIQAENTSAGVVAGASTEKSGDYVERLARYTADNGMVLYGSFQATDTISQKELFGDGAKYLDYVECDAAGQNSNPDECISQKIESYPTWLFQGKQYTGVKSLAEIAQIVGFSE